MAEVKIELSSKNTSGKICKLKNMYVNYEKNCG